MRCAIIGGGAAGLMTAASIIEANPKSEVFIIERNDGLGKKVIISGGGRCNVTTGIHDIRTVLTKYPRGGKFLSLAMYAFSPADVYSWFESHGVPLKTENDLRCFPKSDDGHDIVGVFEKIFNESKDKIMLKSDVTSIKHDKKGFEIYFKGKSETLRVDKVVLTTGGQAYRHTGSTGDGYAFAQALGHTITPLAPSLNSFYTLETWPAEISGVDVEEAKITAKRGNGFSFVGPMLFTHKGITGPAVFALSSLVAFEKVDADNQLEITIDVFPEYSKDELTAQFEKSIFLTPTKAFKNILKEHMPDSFADICLREAELPGEKRANEVAKKDLRRCIDWLKAIPIHVIQRGAGDEFVTAGGVSLSEVNPRTMESKICPGLYFAGEIMDIDGFTGGFNLQASWATGHLAGKSIAASFAGIK